MLALALIGFVVAISRAKGGFAASAFVLYERCVCFAEHVFVAQLGVKDDGTIPFTVRPDVSCLDRDIAYASGGHDGPNIFGFSNHISTRRPMRQLCLSFLEVSPFLRGQFYGRYLNCVRDMRRCPISTRTNTHVTGEDIHRWSVAAIYYIHDKFRCFPVPVRFQQIRDQNQGAVAQVARALGFDSKRADSFSLFTGGDSQSVSIGGSVIHRPQLKVRCQGVSESRYGYDDSSPHRDLLSPSRRLLTLEARRLEVGEPLKYLSLKGGEFFTYLALLFVGVYHARRGLLEPYGGHARLIAGTVAAQVALFLIAIAVLG